MHKKDAKIAPDKRTVGIDFHKWRPNPQQEDGIEIRLIDCAGQRKYLLTHQFFFTEGTTSLVEHTSFDFAFYESVITRLFPVLSWLAWIIYNKVKDTVFNVLGFLIYLHTVYVWKKLVQKCQFTCVPLSARSIALDYLELHLRSKISVAKI